MAVVLLAYCVKDISPSEIRSLTYRLGYLYSVPALVCTFLYVVFRALRWRLMVSHQRSLPFVWTVGLYASGQILNVVMPVLTGQVGRMFLFSKKADLRKTFVFSTVVLEILFDAISLVAFLLVTSLAFVFPERYRYLSIIVGGLTVLVLAGLYLLLHFQYRVQGFGRHHLRERWPGLYVGLRKFIRSFTNGIELLRSSQNLLASLAFSLLSWASHAFVIYFLFCSFGFELPFAAAAAVMIINTLALMIPVTPGNVGTFEVAVSTSLLAFGVGRSDAVLCALALHLLDLLPVFALGLIFISTEKVSLRQIKAQHEDRRILDEVSEEGVLAEEQERA